VLQRSLCLNVPLLICDNFTVGLSDTAMHLIIFIICLHNSTWWSAYTSRRLFL